MTDGQGHSKLDRNKDRDRNTGQVDRWTAIVTGTVTGPKISIFLTLPNSNSGCETFALLQWH